MIMCGAEHEIGSERNTCMQQDIPKFVPELNGQRTPTSEQRTASFPVVWASGRERSGADEDAGGRLRGLVRSCGGTIRGVVCVQRGATSRRPAA